MAIVFLVFTFGYAFWMLLEGWDCFTTSKYVLENNLVNLQKTIPPTLNQKIRYLQKLNQKISIKLDIKTPSLYMADNKQDQATAVNMFFFTGVIFEKKTLEGLNASSLGAILAHELWHIKKYHYLRGIFFKFWVNLLGPLILTGLTYKFNWFFFTEKDSPLLALTQLFNAITVFGLVVVYWSYVVVAIDNFFGRRDEIQCDVFAGRERGFKHFKKQAMYFKDQENIKVPTMASSMRSWVFNTHPSWEDRLDAVKQDLKRVK